MKSKITIGPKTLPCEISLETGHGLEWAIPMRTDKNLLFKTFVIHERRYNINRYSVTIIASWGISFSRLS